MFSTEKWNSVSNWLLENKDVLSDEEKEYWIEELTKQNEQVLEVWSEQLELLDEVKEKLMTTTPLAFQKEGEKLEGISYFHLGIYSKAVNALKEELKISQQPSRLYLYLGYAYLYLNEDHMSKEHFLNVVYQSNDPLEKHFAFLGLGLQAGREDDLEQAISYFEKAERLLFNTDVVYNLGICYLLLKIPSQARHYFEKVIESGEGDGEAYFWLGKTYMEMGNKTLAMETWYEAIHQFDSEPLLLSLALEFEEKGFFSCALFCYERLNDLGYDKSTILHGIYWNYGLMDERNKSKKGFQQLLSYDPTNINVWISYLWLLDKWRDYETMKKEKAKIRSYGIKHPLLKQMTESTSNYID
ncbi:tetratricopeptide repeat protein [Evansella sp. AB-P1]|uniref:tetratricopeptide repeat protein n=1 Tax=Evansella sp. AB-P1 TaxID=3037653 RepID=UPI00241C7049|nr:tetratricopeptide repeat protein [Evansella sp. AB-P1]MDG5787563.1 tetratricopeptide repeat protein [Evansella sp. AB-P1]